jgi:ABC-type lipoprotein export system ATPase subunit
VVEDIHLKPCIELRNIWKGFQGPHGRTEILRGLSFSLFPRDFVGINGVSGAGKSTFLNILAALEKSDEGKVLWNDHCVCSWPAKKLSRCRASQIGFVFQSCHLVPELDVTENILLVCRIARGHVGDKDRLKVQEFLGRLGIGSQAHQLPMTLSGGERQRVAIARALMCHPEVIVADEPTGNLDESTGEQVMRLLEEICEEEHKALLLVTHHVPFSQRMKRQYRLHQGVLEKL